MQDIHIISGSEISQLDYFVYAAKFYPLFPALMFISVLYIYALVVFIFKKRKYQFAFVLSIIGIISLSFVGYILYKPSTYGGRILFMLTMIGIMAYIMISLFIYVQVRKNGKILVN